MTVQLKDYFTVRPQSLGFLLTDAVVMAFAYFFAFLLRFDFSAPWWGWNRVSTSFVTVWAVQTGALALFGCYRMLWRYVSINDFHRFVGALASSTVILAVLRFALPNHFGVRPPYSITLINCEHINPFN
jgi:FlaA1/EpsC-like NDP-sugar epimerase